MIRTSRASFRLLANCTPKGRLDRLRRAFRTAGVKTVISSLWSVDDESTAELMTLFYGNLWVGGMGRLEALRTAQLEMLARNRARHGDPRTATWGAFVLSGEWR